ncbi:tRNA guanosine(34) transglycosylase Tgt [Sandaracinobacter sp. RS1-74]|uniref:tRNA guanosine(34) transglycosylase Tgt n=1 Tax=Sandaracinobacteroides sayramensis TaxID=2913411 RepID=UPI001EDBBB45|nr:tRNA guanosine(34) transglycosylase Tgt [Sandaracinobacteroides sayramensis]MCG2841500.1 tRNA guanosine(34) transglycosylase Tgt [Sandaracinobacteroides sayramensis]
MKLNQFTFHLHATDGRARTGVIRTDRGDIRTPAFMPVGTAATVKGMHPEQVRAAGADILLGNTYHLMLRPGAERMARLGGLHRFMNWEGPILTDSGGFQVMSLGALVKIAEEGVSFQSHIDGSKHFVSPERSVEIQRLLGSDIVMAFDECIAHPATHEDAARAMRLSMRWAKRSREAFLADPAPALFGIQQGNVFEDLRRESAERLIEVGFEGYAIGGLAVGEGQEAMFGVLDYAPGLLPADKPRYLMGVGKPSDIIGAVLRGVDMFDCVMPTRSGRTAQAFVMDGTLNLRNARHAEDVGPVDAECPCPTCAHYSRAYLHHLIKAEEMLGPMLLTQHNIWHYQQLMQGLRDAIAAGRVEAFARERLGRLSGEGG